MSGFRESTPELVVGTETAQFLEQEGLLSPAVNNKRRLSTSILSSSSRSSESSATTRASTASFSAHSVCEEADTVLIPDSLRSRETLTFIGFTDEVAEDIWHRYITKPADMDDDLYDFATARIYGSPIPDATSGLDDWDACLQGLGINIQLRNAILMPEFEDIRYTASCKFWVLDAIEMNYKSLRGLDDALRMEQARIQHHRKTGRKHAGSISETPSAPSPRSKKGQSSSSSSSTQPAQRPGGVSAKPVAESSKAAASTTTAVEIPATLPGHHMIWRSGSKDSAAAFYDETTGQVNLLAISMRPGDFSARKAVAYFSPQKETADRYACWQKHKYPVCSIAIIQVAVPDELLKELTIQYLWFEDRSKPTDEWKKLIWYSRRNMELPEDLDWIEDKDLLIGLIASSNNVKYEKLVSYNAINESDLVHIKMDGESRKAIQWVFQTKKATRGFQQKCSGKIWVHPMGTLKVPKASEGS